MPFGRTDPPRRWCLLSPARPMPYAPRQRSRLWTAGRCLLLHGLPHLRITVTMATWQDVPDTVHRDASRPTEMTDVAAGLHQPARPAEARQQAAGPAAPLAAARSGCSKVRHLSALMCLRHDGGADGRHSRASRHGCRCFVPFYYAPLTVDGNEVRTALEASGF